MRAREKLIIISAFWARTHMLELELKQAPRRQLTAIFGLLDSPPAPLPSRCLSVSYTENFYCQMRALTPPNAYSTHTHTGAWQDIEQGRGWRGRQAAHTHLRFNSPTIRRLASSVSFRAQSSHYLRQRARLEVSQQNIAYTPRAASALSRSLLSLPLCLCLSFSSFVCEKWQNVIFGIFCYCQNGLSTSATTLPISLSLSLCLPLSCSLAHTI